MVVANKCLCGCCIGEPDLLIAAVLPSSPEVSFSAAPKKGMSQLLIVFS